MHVPTLDNTTSRIPLVNFCEGESGGNSRVIPIPLSRLEDLLQGELLEEPVHKVIATAQWRQAPKAVTCIADGGIFIEIVPVKSRLDRAGLMKLGAYITKRYREQTHLLVDLRPLSKANDNEHLSACYLAQGAVLGGYALARADTSARIRDIVFRTPSADQAMLHWSRLLAVAEGELLARDLVNSPPNVLTPKAFADCCSEFSSLGAEVEVLDQRQLEELGMGCILAVGRGSSEPSYVATVAWHGGGDEPEFVVAGKGVCFDSGGLSLKGPEAMMPMKSDMAGAAAAVGTVVAAARRGARANIAAIVGLVENMPSGSAVRPGDVVSAFDGRLVEILNADYEGRLVLADVTAFARKRFPKSVIASIGTLTGGVKVALGTSYAGLFTSNKALAELALAAGDASCNKLWRLPVDSTFDPDLISQVADLRNLGMTKAGQASVCARFVQSFAEPGDWLHLDICGVAMVDQEWELGPAGATGYGVRLLEEILTEGFEARNDRMILE